MQQQKFETLVARLEQAAHERPIRYLATAMAVAALGIAILGLAVALAVLAAALLVGLIVAVIATGGKAAMPLLYLGKGLIFLLVPVWVMVRSAVTILLGRIPAPQGRAVLPHEAPELFARLESLKQKTGGPRVHNVLLVDALNAAIVQHPRFGLFGWERNYLILGLPLLQAMSADEALSVVAHEYGHLSGYHARFGGFIYRFRAAWARLQTLSQRWTDWGSRLIAGLFRWYAPYFNAYTFVLARQNEYVADQIAAEFGGRDNAARALMRINVTAAFEATDFWPSVDRRAGAEAEPPSRTSLWHEALATALPEERRRQYLAQALQRKTDLLDTHPALKDRLASMGVVATGEIEADLSPPAQSAADAWFGEKSAAIKAEFDAAWRKNIAEQWQTRHAYLGKRQGRLAELETRATRDAKEEWERIQLLEELRPGTDILPLVQAYLAATPDSLPARFRHGCLLLARNDEAGIDEIEQVMALDQNCVLPGCEAAWRFYQTRAPEKAAQYAARWQQRNEHVRQVQAELARITAAAEFAAVDLPAETVEQIKAILRQDREGIREAYLVRRVLHADSNVSQYLVAFETKRFGRPTTGAKAGARVAKLTFPIPLSFVHLGEPSTMPLRKRVRQQGIALLDR